MFRKIIFSFLLFCYGILSAQDTNTSIEIGDLLIISEPVNDTYNHIDFPRKNTIIKRGAIANFNTLKGIKVIVEEVNTLKDGSTQLNLKRNDGKKFFRFYSTVTADYNKAISSGEIKMVSKNNR